MEPDRCRPGPPVTATAPYELSVRCANGDVKLQVEHLALSNGRSAFNSVEGPTSAKVKLIMAKCGERVSSPESTAQRSPSQGGVIVTGWRPGWQLVFAWLLVTTVAALFYFAPMARVLGALSLVGG